VRTTARVVVVGGGIAGVSVLYHLAKRGWSDVVLFERRSLTSGSTWHAAGLLPLFNMSYAVGQLHRYSVELYKTLEAETGQPVGFHPTGNLRLARNRDRLDEYRNYQATAETIGVECHILSPAEVKDLWPLLDPEGIIGALWHPTDGHIAPADVTMAMAKGARRLGAEIHEHTPVEAITRTRSGEWLVRTAKGEVRCEHVVAATGNHARETARMVGLEIPVVPVEHQYVITDVDPELARYREAGHAELPILREPDESYYLREEQRGWIIGPYERHPKACFVDGVPEDFEHQLFPGDLDRILPHVEGCMRRVPSLQKVGIKQVLNGPIPYTPDGSPMVGPAFGLPNFWLNEGHSFGITAAGGAGWQLANWIIDGEPSIDMLGVDPRRFGVVTKRYAVAKNEEAYAYVYFTHYPMEYENRPAARPARTPPVYDRLKAMGAVFGMRFGWERPNWFAPKGVKPEDRFSFRRSNWFPHVAEEVKALREQVGLIELSSFAKFEVSGPGARRWLDSLLANRLPAKVGQIRLCHILNRSGSVRSEFTVTRLADGPYGERFYLVGPGAAHDLDLDLLTRLLPRDGSVVLEDVTTRYGVFVVAGPMARALLQEITDADLANQALPWLHGAEVPIGFADRVRLLRVGFTGSLGFELHHPIEYQLHLFELLIETGARFGLKLCGMRAMDSCRLEKSYRLWGTDLNGENSLLEAGMERFVAFDKGAFPGREALLRQKAEGLPTRFCTIEVDVADADPFGNEPVFFDDRVIGRGTAGGFGHHIQKSLLLAYVRSEYAQIGLECRVRVLDELRPARIIAESPYDPENRVLRA